MGRRHALQTRAGEARHLSVRVTDVEHSGLVKLAGDRAVSDVVRGAIRNQVVHGYGSPSAFWPVFSTLIEQLNDAGVSPILVGLWAASAHGYVSASPTFDLLVRSAEKEKLRAFLTARGASDDVAMPVAVGREPWRATFDTHLGGVAADDIAVDRFDLRSGPLDVISAKALIALGEGKLDEHVIDAIRDIKAGTCADDEGERGAIAWDMAGRLTASGAYADETSRRPNRFVDFRIIEALR